MSESEAGSVLVVDDDAVNRVMLSHILKQEGYSVTTAVAGEPALEMLDARPFDIVLLDLRMPGMNGIEVCERIRANTLTYALPVLIITGEGEEEKINALEAGADDFILKPYDRAELLARVRSLLRIKSYHDTIQAQAAQLSDLNRSLEERVQQQVRELERLGSLRRLVSPALAEMLLSSGEEMLDPHRREIAVLFCDMRGFTAFSESSEPEDLMKVLGEFHEAIGRELRRFEATIGYFAGDAVMAFFNDPIPCPDPELRAVKTAFALRASLGELVSRWSRLGHELDLGIGVASGFATLGMLGSEGRFEYTAIGTVVNLASRLCSQAGGGQILLSQRAYQATDRSLEVDRVDDLVLKGLRRPVPAYSARALRDESSVPPDQP